MIRALIATINGESVTLEPTTDRELIAKVIRQGGRRIWVDASDSDDTERGWLATLFRVPDAQLLIDYPFLEQDPGLTLCIPSISRVEDASKPLPILPILLIARSDDKLLTLHPARVTLLNAAFERAARTPVDWQISTAPLISGIIHAALEPILTAQIAVTQEYSALSRQVIGKIPPDALPALLANIYTWRMRAVELVTLTDRPISMIRKLTPPAQPLLNATGVQQFGAQQFDGLAYHLEMTHQMLADQIAASGALTALIASHETAELTKRVLGISVLLLITLPIIATSLIALIVLTLTPLTSPISITISVMLMIVTLTVALLVGKSRRWW